MSQREDASGRAGAWSLVGLAFVWDFSKSTLNVLARALFAQSADSETNPRERHRTGRSGDRDKDLEAAADLASRERWGTLWFTLAFSAGIAAGVGFIFTYWTGGNNLLLGGTLALFLGLVGCSLVLYAHWLIRHKEATAPREFLSSRPEERRAVREEYYAGEHDSRRRALLVWMSMAAVGVIAAMVVSLMRSLGSPPGPSLLDTVWKRGQRLMTLDHKPMTVNSLDVGSTMTVFPEDSVGDEKAQTVLIRVDERFLQLPRDRASWAPKGFLAYSRVCTHAGCPVGLYLATIDQLMCPCHQSTFNVLQGAQPTGGPAVRALPQLPLYIDADGTLRAGGGFSEPPGPGYWGMPGRLP
jgi:ubiquinol-cytochrome c reductase iron-sulfur subunit